ncbi:MAG: hypothetical protein EBU43_06055 [Actinobacteria bacterium]|nr:hypothetical protein [Actinomycetota bacterium]NBP91894.1 hypothetical protein [Actinomycetota bacterium]
MSRSRKSLLVLAALLTSLTLAACGEGVEGGEESGGGDDDGVPSAPLTPNTPQADPAGSSQALPPIMVDEVNTSASLPMTNTLVFNLTNPGAWSFAGEPGDILEFTPGGDQGTYTTNPSAKPLKPGVVKVTASDGKQKITFTITVTQ